MALAVARYLVVFLKRPGGKAQFSTALALQSADDKFGALHTGSTSIWRAIFRFRSLPIRPG